MAKHGKDFYKSIGAKGGYACVKKGFGKDPKLAKKAGQKGGQTSHRGDPIIYAVWKGDKKIFVGGVKEIAEELKVSTCTVSNYANRGTTLRDLYIERLGYKSEVEKAL